MWFCERIHDLKIEEAVINFLPSWWYRHYGIEYGRKMYFDPDYRIETYINMRELYYQRFGKDTGTCCKNPKPMVIQPDFDNTFYQSMLGLEVRFPVDQYPMGIGALTDEQIMDLEVPEDLWGVYPYKEVKSQVEYMNRRLGTSVPPMMKTRGILNEAVQICSTEFYGYLLDEDYEDVIKKAMGFVSGVLQQQIRRNCELDSDFMHIMMNCTCAVAGAPTYKSKVFAYDWQLYEQCVKHGRSIGLHHCGRFDDFVDIYGTMDKLSYIEIGHESSIRPVLEQFKTAHIQYIMSTKLLNFGTVDEIREKIGEILEETEGHWDRFSIQAPDLDASVPDENIFALIDALKK
ncbi:MAG: hypothetical protein Q4D16_21365 [Eubacteriales bacterium]|nr:hypothetical protein [Eubacteriales bacterium]